MEIRFVVIRCMIRVVISEYLPKNHCHGWKGYKKKMIQDFIYFIYLESRYLIYFKITSCNHYELCVMQFLKYYIKRLMNSCTILNKIIHF